MLKTFLASAGVCSSACGNHLFTTTLRSIPIQILNHTNSCRNQISNHRSDVKTEQGWRRSYSVNFVSEMMNQSAHASTLSSAVPPQVLTDNKSSSNSSTPAKKSRKQTKPKQVMTLTDRAADRLKYLMSKRPGTLGILIGLKKRGCNGLSWTFDYITQETEIPKLAEIVEDKGVRLVIQPSAVMNVIGTVMDYEENEVFAKFVFNNPNAIGTCGCGESFNVQTAANEKEVLQRKSQKM
nr:unnamed protein product [Naegleria fowleri]